jgi:hypothetical protein
MVRRRPALATALVVALAGRARAAPPEPEEDPRAVEARKACAAGQVDRGIQLLADYLATTSDVTAIYNMGRCYQQNGVSDKALLSFREYLRKAPDVSAEDRREVEQYIAELESEQRSRSALGAPATLEAAAAPALEGDGRPALRTAGLALGAAGVLALGAGIIFGLKVRSANEDLAREQTYPEWSRHRSDGERAETAQWILLGLGGAALVAGGVCYVLALPPRRDRSALLPFGLPGGGGLALSGRY